MTLLRWPAVLQANAQPASSSGQSTFPARLAFALALTLTAAGCAHRTRTTQPPVQLPPEQPAPAPGAPETAPPAPAPKAPPAVVKPALPGEYVEEGVASWYGNPFDGHRTSNGEIYDMHQFTAAHRTLPFGAVVRVTNLNNGKQTEVRINDRGPFVANRVIDLSLSAAQAIGMVGPGTAPVRLEVIAGPNPTVGFFGVQVGAFQQQENAQRLRDRLAMSYAPVNIALYDSPNGLFYRVRVGRMTTEGAAQQLASQLRSNEQLTTFVVRLDD
ncbi:MAG TPA: septal ring lytic transglycosylase RlpA family protein [Verrucomicrobiae bacterium]|nr:septal ring lytic transglycosylase RlpA family protein [Verrucomicrobiae bacterium]